MLAMAPTSPLGPAPADRVRLVIGLVVGLYWFIAAIAMRQQLLSDPDIWWHVKTGQWIRAQGHMPITDPFSFSFTGQPWIAKEWLSQLAYSLAFDAGGWGGVLLLGAVALALGAMLLYWRISDVLNPGLAAGMALLFIFLASSAFTIRPHLLTLPIVVLWTGALFAASGKGSAPSFLWLGLILLWANFHAAFTIGFVIAGFAFLDFLATTRLANRKATVAWLLFLVLCPVVTLIHPYGYQAMLATWLVVGPNEAVGQINEWQPFNAQKHWPHAAALLGLLFAALVSGFRLGIARALLLALLTYLFMTHVRYAFFLFPVTAIVIAPALADQFQRLSAGHWRSAPLERSERLIGNFSGWVVAAIALAFAGGAGLVMAVLHTAPPERMSASAAIAFARSHGLNGHVFNHHDFGGPLIFNNFATFIDGRTDQLFLDSFVKTYMFGPKTAAEMAATLQRYDISWSLLPPDDPRNALIASLPGWHQVYADSYAVIQQRQ